MGCRVTQIIGAVARYSVADHLAKGPATADDIAAWEGINPNATFRLLRVCASLGFVSYEENKFKAKPILGTLQRDVPGSLNSLAIHQSQPSTWMPCGRFAEAIRTGFQFSKVRPIRAPMAIVEATVPEQN